MQKKFETEMERLIENFSIDPSEHVWLEVEKTLHAKRKRRFAAWFLLPLALLITGITSFLLYQNFDKKENTVVKNNTVTKNANIKNNEALQQHTSPKNQTLLNSSTPKKINETNHSSTQKTYFSINKLDNKKSGKPNVVSIQNNKSTTKNAKPSLDVINESKNNSNILTVNTNNESNTNKATKSIQKQFFIDDNIKNTDSTKTKQQNQPNQKTSTKNWQKYFSFAAGSFNVTNSLNLFNTQKSFDTYSNSTSSSISGVTTPSTYYNATNGFTLQAGLLLQKNVSSKFLFNTGLSINYYTNKQKVGNIKDSLADRANLSYKPGFTNTQTNNLFALQIPTTFLCYVKPKGKTKFFVSAGLQTNIVLYKKWLVPDKVLDGFYYHKSALPNIQLNAMLGIGASFKNTSQLSINYNHSINRFYRINSESKYAQQLYFQFSYPILSNKK